MSTTQRLRIRQLVPVIGLLLVLFFIRTHNILVQNPYVDEGFHIKRAGIVWNFDQNPGRISHGKLLLYYWLGLFETGPETALGASRLGMAVYSLITGSTIYLLGRLLYKHSAGLIALGLYAILPLAVFYERMAMADPIAAGLAAIIAWRSLVFAKRPDTRHSIEIGVLLALATLAKLTMGFLPLLPGIAALIYTSWHRQQIGQQIITFVKVYAPPLVIAAFVVGLIWAPLAIPAYFARNSDDPFLLVDSFNVRTSAQEPASPIEYFDETLPLIEQVATRALLLALVAAAVYQLVSVVWNRRTFRSGLFVLSWFLLILGLTLFGARLSTLRYVMPLGVPAVLILGGAAASLADIRPPALRWIVRPALAIVIAAWAIDFALPFLRTDLRNPDDLDFSSTNWTEYQSGYLIADDAVREAADALNAIQPHPKPLYATWWLCHLMYFYTDDPATCLDYSQPLKNLLPALESLPPGDSAYVASAGYQPFLDRVPGLCSEQIGQYDRVKIRNPVWDVWVWRVWWGDDC